MAIVFDWPDALRPTSVDWGLITPQLMGRSVFDSTAQADSLGAPRWAITITTGVMRRDEVPDWEAHILRLRGMVNRVRCWDWRREAPLGVATGAPVVRVAGLGASLAVEGWTPSVAGILRAGSWMGINGELKQLTETINSDALGRATIKFEPPLRALAAVGIPLILTKPTAKFMLTTEKPSMSQQGARAPGTTYSFEEDFAP